MVHRTPWPGPPVSSLCIVLQPHGLLVIHESHQDHATLPHCGHLLLKLLWGLPLGYNFCSFRTSLNVTISESLHSFPTIFYPTPGSSHWYTCIWMHFPAFRVWVSFLSLKGRHLMSTPNTSVVLRGVPWYTLVNSMHVPEETRTGRNKVY